MIVITLTLYDDLTERDVEVKWKEFLKNFNDYRWAISGKNESLYGLTKQEDTLEPLKEIIMGRKKGSKNKIKETKPEIKKEVEVTV